MLQVTSDRENQVLNLIADGLTQGEISCKSIDEPSYLRKSHGSRLWNAGGFVYFIRTSIRSKPRDTIDY
jgi:hypothetical protein